MVKRLGQFLMVCLALGGLSACSTVPTRPSRAWDLKDMVAPLQKSVVMVAAYDAEDKMNTIGSGFFIDRQGTLVTNYHVLDGAYKAEVKTADGGKYAVEEVLAANQLVDLMTVRVDIPGRLAVPVVRAAQEPAVADRVVVIGSPLGLEQTISEGIISAVREHPTNGKIYQLSAPISEGSSGSPAMNLSGEVIGVVSFQSARGQNINFAVSIDALDMLTRQPGELSLAEWTIRNSGHDPAVAVSLCREGAHLSIRGKYEAALDYFQKATESNPDDAAAWRGLGSCYIGLNQPDNAVEAYHRAIAVNPDNASARFMLAMYYKVLEQYPKEVSLLLEVIGIDPANLRARFELAIAYGKLEQTGKQIDVLEQILDLNPDNVPALHLMGQTIGRAGRYDDALELLLKAVALAPENARIHFDIGVTYHLKKLPQEEMRAYIRAIQADPRLAPAHHNMGLLFLSQGNRRLALQQYEILKGLDKALAEGLFRQIYPEEIDAIRQP